MNTVYEDNGFGGSVPLPASLSAILFSINADGVCTRCDGGGLEGFGLVPEAMIGRPLDDGHGDERLTGALRRALAGDSFVETVELDAGSLEMYAIPDIDSTGRIIGIKGMLSPLTDRHDTLLALERAINEARAFREASDPRLVGHVEIIDALRGAMAAGDDARLAVVFADVDGLRSVNTTWGHSVGDALLVKLSRALRRDGAIVGRYGGDEFVAVLPDADLAAAERYQAAVIHAIEHEPFVEAGIPVPFHVSFGTALRPQEGRTADDLLLLAEAALRAARRSRGVPSGDGARERLDGESAARLVGEIVPLLRAPGTREEKLAQVAHQLAVGAGYDAVNFEVSGDEAQRSSPWETTLSRSPAESVEEWVREQSQATDHPLSRVMAQSLGPVFIASLAETDLMTEREREILVGAGFRSALAVPMIWHERLVGMLSVGSKQRAAFTAWDAQFLTAVSSQVTAIVFMTTLVEDLQRASNNLSRAHAETVMMLARAAEAHDHTTGRHLQRVRAVSEALALELGYGDEHARQLGLAAVLHDIGKIRVPDGVLTSPRQLTESEWAQMKQHTTWGSDFLDGRHGFDLASLVALCHHESWDGTGYPRGLKGEEIPEAAAITAVADSFDAMTHDRPYRPGRSVIEAVHEIVRCSGTQFSPRIVEAMVRLYESGALASDMCEDVHARAA